MYTVLANGVKLHGISVENAAILISECESFYQDPALPNGGYGYLRGRCLTFVYSAKK